MDPPIEGYWRFRAEARPSERALFKTLARWGLHTPTRRAALAGMRPSERR
jgi:hypothetical protein